MKAKILNPEPLNHYRFLVFLGAPVLIIGGFFLDKIIEPGPGVVFTRHALVFCSVLSIFVSYYSVWWRKYIGEITLPICFLMTLNASLVLYYGRIGTIETIYALVTISLISATFHKVYLILSYQIPTVFFYIVVGYLVENPLIDPIVLTVALLTFSVISTYLAVTTIYAKSMWERSETIANLWFDHGADGMIYGSTSKATPDRVNPRAYQLLETSNDSECVDLLWRAFLAESVDSDRKKALVRILEDPDWERTLQIKTARGNFFWGNVVVRALKMRGLSDLTLIRITDVSDRVAHERELETAKAEAESTTETKARFLANMSHEIRTPMNGVIGMTSLLMDTNLDMQQRSYLEIIRSSGESLLSIINEILDFSKIDADQVELEEQVFDLETCVAEAMDIIAPVAANKDLELLLGFDVDSIRFCIGDVTRIRQILVNLLSNAVKFTNHGEVTVEVAVEVQEMDSVVVKFAIYDTGIGISQAQLDNLFAPFVQADVSTTRKFGGTGLGLSICKGLVERMGGCISASSRIDHGSCFSFDIHLRMASEENTQWYDEFPDKKALVLEPNRRSGKLLSRMLDNMAVENVVIQDLLDVPANLEGFDLLIIDEIAYSRDLLIEEIRRSRRPTVVIHSINSTSAVTRHEYAIRKPIRPSGFYEVVANALSGEVQKKVDVRLKSFTALPLEGKTFLLAEDNLVNQKVAVQILKKIGVRLDVVGNGKEAVEMVNQRGYDFVFMDVQMPVLDGLEATRLIRRKDGIQQPYIVAMTANAMNEDKDRCLAAGMDDFLAKPIRVDDVFSVLRSAIDRQNPH